MPTDRLSQNHSLSPCLWPITAYNCRKRDSQHRCAPFTMADPAVHDGAIEVFTMGETRTYRRTHTFSVLIGRSASLA